MLHLFWARIVGRTERVSEFRQRRFIGRVRWPSKAVANIRSMNALDETKNAFVCATVRRVSWPVCARRITPILVSKPS